MCQMNVQTLGSFRTHEFPPNWERTSICSKNIGYKNYYFLKRGKKNPTVISCIYLTLIFLIFLMFFMVTRPLSAEELKDSKEWSLDLSIYAWVPSIDGTLKYAPSDTGSDQEVDAGSIIDKIQTVFMGDIEVYNNKWSFQGDFIYLNLADQTEDSVNLNLNQGYDINTSVEASLTGWYLGLSGGYSIMKSDRVSVYLLLGTRYLSIETEIDLDISGPLPPTLPGKSLDASTEILDGVVGVKGRLFMGSRWYVPYHLDVGTGTSVLTWQAMTGVAYAWTKVNLFLVYRHISFDEGSDELLQNFTLSGPALGVKVIF